jgi:uroporphyrinogen-III decarboxylase
MHLMTKELMPYDHFFLQLNDNQEEMERLAEKIGLYFERLFRVAVASPAEVFFLGGNFDAMVTPPPIYDRYIKPWVRKFARMLHAKGKYLLCHTDGENTGLLQHYLESEFDIADSVCPKPMTKLTFREHREAFGDRMTIMGGIPSVTLLKNSMSDRDFEAYLDNFFLEIGDGRHLILGISDTTPPDADFSRILKIRDRAAAFGPVRGD